MAGYISSNYIISVTKRTYTTLSRTIPNYLEFVFDDLIQGVEFLAELRYQYFCILV